MVGSVDLGHVLGIMNAISKAAESELMLSGKLEVFLNVDPPKMLAVIEMDMNTPFLRTVEED